MKVWYLTRERSYLNTELTSDFHVNVSLRRSMQLKPFSPKQTDNDERHSRTHCRKLHSVLMVQSISKKAFEGSFGLQATPSIDTSA